MAIVSCGECGKEMSNQARQCPCCGAPNKSAPMSGGVKTLLWGLALVLGVGILVPIVNTASKPTLTPEQKDMKIRARVAIIQCKASKYCAEYELNNRIAEYERIFGESPE